MTDSSLPDDKIDDLLASLTPAEITAVERQALASLVRAEDSPDSFFAFYRLMSGIDPPEHVKNWIRFIYGGKSRDRGSLVWSFRGSWKTTSISIFFTAYRIGKNPERANLILQVNDESAQKTAAAVARIIDLHPGWKLCFAHVVPDKERGWSQAGYEVKATHWPGSDGALVELPYDEWIAKNAARKDPSLLGLGFSSGSVIGKHPDGVLMIDDIHDEANTVSVRERAGVVKVLTGTILPLVVEDVTRTPGQRLVTWEIVVGTPWTEDDAYHYLRSTGEFEFTMTPVMEIAPEGTPETVYFEQKEIQGWYLLTWPERFPYSVIMSWFRKSAAREFGRMYMLNLELAQTTGLRFHSYPHELIDLRWPTSGGVDYASTILIRGRVVEEKNLSKFALFWGMKKPTGGAVIYDGVVGHVTQLEAEDHVEKGQMAFPNYLATGVEMNGVGAQFFALLQRKPKLKLIPFWTGRLEKTDRQERELSPRLESGMLRISDEETPALNALRKALKDWPNGSLDEIDALYAYCKTVPDVWIVPDDSESLPSLEPRDKVNLDNPFAAFGKQ